MKLAIVGSRSFNDYSELCEFIKENYDIDEITHIVSGGARGADTLGLQFAKEYNKEVILFMPDWDKHGRKAGFLRNFDIVKTCDECVVFWDGESHGAKHDITLCERYKKPCKVYKFNL